MSSTNSLEPSPSAGLPTRADHWESSFIGRLLWRHRWQLLMASLAGAVLLAAGSYLIPPTFTGRTTFLPPQQSSSPAISALASLGALAGAGPQVRNSGDQYLAFLQSVSIRDRLVDRFDLMRVYDENLRVDTRVTLSDNTRLSLGRKDGLLSIEVDDKDPQRAADLANAYVEELQQLTDKLTLTEAQQRRAFFEGQMKQVRQRLSEAQQQLQATGISANAIKAEPKATADGYAKLRAELTSAKIRLAAMRRSLADDTPEVQRQLVAVSTLSRDLQGLEEQDDDAPANGYVAAYRELKYHEALFELIARQYEAAKVDESRDGGQLQLIDRAAKAERKSKPKRSLLAALGLVGGLLVGAFWLIRREYRRPAL